MHSQFNAEWHTTPVCRSDRFVYSGRIKQPFFCSTSTKKDRHSGEAYCAVRNRTAHLSLCQNREREAVAAPPPLPPLLQDMGYSAERWNNAVAGLCLSCGRGNYCWDSHGSDRPRWNTGRQTHLYEAVRLSSRSVWRQRTALQTSFIWRWSDRRLNLVLFAKPVNRRPWGDDELTRAGRGWSAGEFPQIVSLGKKHEDAAVSTRLITDQTSIKMELHGILH